VQIFFANKKPFGEFKTGVRRIFVLALSDILKTFEGVMKISFDPASTYGMTRLLFFIFVLFSSFNAVGQQQNCLNDTPSLSGQIIGRIKSDGFAGATITIKKTGNKYQGYRICEHHYVQVDSLNGLLTDLQIDTLLSCTNGTLKTVGFILYSKRHNDKESVIKKLREILSQEYIVMTNSCSDAIQFSSLGRITYDLLTKTNFFLKPNFKLTKEDKALLDLDLASYELLMKSN
jgi:hypothetical protein